MNDTAISSAESAQSGGAAINTTFVNGLALLEALAHAGEPSGVSELARHLELTKSNVHRLLKTLRDCGYVQNVGATGRYEITLKLWELGVAVLDKLDVKRIALEPMERLVSLTGETVHLSILDRGEVVYIDKMDSPQPVRAYSKIGGRAPAYCVATGKALLAFAGKDVIDGVAKDLRRYTPSTITTEAELLEELQRVVENGFAINKGEWREGVCGVAAPIRDAHGHVIAAIGISGPIDRLKVRTLRQFAPHTIEIAKSISSRLGWSG